MKKTKQLRIWNGRGQGKFLHGHIYVAAYSQAEAARIVSAACDSLTTAHEIKKYFSPDSWGIQMNRIVPTEPCVYVAQEYFDTPKRIL